jgi:hypothetical protein
MRLSSFIYLFSFVFLISTVFSQTGSVEVEFSTGKGYSCISEEYTAYWQKIDTNERVNIFSDFKTTTGVCNDTVYSNNWCCPTGYHCVEGECLLPDTQYIADMCTSITDSFSCDYADSSFAINQVKNFGGVYSDVCSSGGSYNGFFDYAASSVCANVTICGCSWDSSANSGEGACALNISLERVCPNSQQIIGSCSWLEDTATDSCESEGSVIISYKASTEGSYPDLCADQQVSYPCSVSVQLPFFDGFNFILSFLLIAVVYFFYVKLNLRNKFK